MYAGLCSCRPAWVAFAAAVFACLLHGSTVEGAEDGPVHKYYITWKKSPKKCINLVGGKRNNGNVAELADCKDIDTMQFVVPASGKGLIKLLGTEKEDKSLCLDAPDDAQLMWWDCEKGSADNKMFLMPEDGVGKIQLASDANKCITVPSGASNGEWLYMGKCSAEEAESTLFKLKTVPIGCGWSAWSDWTTCSDACGGGMQSRQREVTQEAENGEPCDGKLVDLGRCNTQLCKAK